MTTMEEFFKTFKEDIERAQAIWIINNMDLIRGYAKIKYTFLAYLQMGLYCLTLPFLVTMFAPQLCRKSAAFNAIAAGIITLILWKFCPATHIFPQLIYQEWFVSMVVFFGTALFDKRKIDALEKL